MNKNKRCLSVLSSTVMGLVIASALTTNAHAAVKSYVVKDASGNIISFNIDDLASDYANKLSGAASPMFDEYVKDTVVAFQDSVKGYVSYDSVMKAYTDAVATDGGKTFNLDKFTENADDADIAKDITAGYVWDTTKNQITAIDNSTTVSPAGDLKTKLDSLVTAGTITAAQETAVINLNIFDPPTNNTGGSTGTPTGNPTDSIKTKLDSLVTAGTITETQETAILNVIKPSNGGSSNTNGGQDDTISATTGTAAYSQSGNTVIKSNQIITASNADESAVKVTDSGTFTLSDSTITTSGNTSSMDNSSFYGLNAAVLAESGSKITLSNTKINATGTGANGAFACGTGSTVNLSNVDINCTNTGAHGVDATKAGVLNLNNVNITTSGDGASAAIATDRGGGTINVTGGVVTTNGTKSPGVYSTGDITVSDATIKTNKSEAVTVEGENSVKLTNCSLTSEKNYGAFIYQSFSGDAEVGCGSFTMEGGSLTAKEGPMFYSTNTTAEINLKGAALNNASGVLLKAGADQWGTTGANGSTVTLNADSQSLLGSIILDNVSSATLNLKNGSSLTSTVNADNTAKSAAVTLDTTSTWNVTGNSYVTSITDGDTTLANINDNGHTVYYNSSNSKNSWLNGKTITLKSGGKLTPMSTSN